MQRQRTAKRYDPILTGPGNPATEDAAGRQRKWTVSQRTADESDACFLERLNAPLVEAKLPRFDGLKTGKEGLEVLGISEIVPGEYESTLIVLLGRGTEMYLSSVDVHEEGYDETSCLVITFVRASDGELYLVVVREPRHTLLLNPGETTRIIPENDGKPRYGWLARFPQAFAKSAKLAAFLNLEVASKLRNIPLDAPAHTPSDRAKLARAVRSVIGRKAGEIVAHPGIELVAAQYVDTTPENPGKSGTCFPVVALELRFTDPEFERACLWGYPREEVKPLHFGPGSMRSHFVPWKEILTSAGRRRYALECLFSLGAITLFREVLEEGRLKESR